MQLSGKDLLLALSSMEVKEYIKAYPNAISHTLADEVIQHYHTNGEWNQSSFSTNEGISPRSKERVDMKEKIEKSITECERIKKRLWIWTK